MARASESPGPRVAPGHFGPKQTLITKPVDIKYGLKFPFDCQLKKLQVIVGRIAKHLWARTSRKTCYKLASRL
jgi:hypothetical protein